MPAAFRGEAGGDPPAARGVIKARTDYENCIPFVGVGGWGWIGGLGGGRGVLYGCLFPEEPEAPARAAAFSFWGALPNLNHGNRTTARTLLFRCASRAAAGWALEAMGAGAVPARGIRSGGV